MNGTITSQTQAGYVLRFRPLFNEGRDYAFPCDAHGRVDLDGLSDSARNNYFFARTVVGRDFTLPQVVRA